MGKKFLLKTKCLAQPPIAIATKKDATKKDATKKDAKKKDATKDDATKKDATKKDATHRSGKLILRSAPGYQDAIFVTFLLCLPFVVSP